MGLKGAFDQASFMSKKAITIPSLESMLGEPVAAAIGNALALTDNDANKYPGEGGGRTSSADSVAHSSSKEAVGMQKASSTIGGSGGAALPAPVPGGLTQPSSAGLRAGSPVPSVPPIDLTGMKNLRKPSGGSRHRAL